VRVERLAHALECLRNELREGRLWRRGWSRVRRRRGAHYGRRRRGWRWLGRRLFAATARQRQDQGQDSGRHHSQNGPHLPKVSNKPQVRRAQAFSRFGVTREVGFG
jgi:hypothetical protein